MAGDIVQAATKPQDSAASPAFTRVAAGPATGAPAASAPRRRSAVTTRERHGPRSGRGRADGPAERGGPFVRDRTAGEGRDQGAQSSA